MSTTGRVAIVTGATGGIGPSICRRLVASGWAVGVGHVPDDDAARAAEELTRSIVDGGGRAVAAAADLGRPDQISDLVGAVRGSLGPVSGVVCAAAVSVTQQRPWTQFDADDWSHVMAVNVVGTALTLRAAHDDLAATRGSVVVLSSVTPLLGRTGNLPYVTSKAALIGLTRSLAREWGPDGVRVNAVAPGAIRTPDEAFYGSEEELEGVLFPLQSLPRRGEPADVANAVDFLLSAESDFITGQVLVVDGGWVMP